MNFSIKLRFHLTRGLGGLFAAYLILLHYLIRLTMNFSQSPPFVILQAMIKLIHLGELENF